MAQEIVHSKDSKSHPDIDMNQLTLYGSPFCPFVRRVLLTLDLKQIPFKFVQIDLLNKPDWYVKEVNPSGKVPYLKQGDKELIESLVIANYLDDIKQPSIHPSDPYVKARGRLLVDELFPLGLVAIKNVKNKELALEQRIDDIKNGLAKLDNQFAQIKTRYLQSDDKPYYADYMTYTSLEMIVPCLATLNYPAFNSEKDVAEAYPSLTKYLKLMEQNPSVLRVCPSAKVQAEYYALI